MEMQGERARNTVRSDSLFNTFHFAHKLCFTSLVYIYQNDGLIKEKNTGCQYGGG